MTNAADVPRSRDELNRAFQSLGIRESAYHLYGAHIEDAFVMDNRPVGWVVFYSERGTESIIGTYETEAEACRELYTRVIAEDNNYFGLVAGPALPLEADRAFDDWLRSHHTDRSALASELWKYDDVPWKVDSPYFRRYFVRITTIRDLSSASPEA